MFGRDLGRAFPACNIQGLPIIFLRRASFLANITDHPQANQSPGSYPSVIRGIVLESPVEKIDGFGEFALVEVDLA